MDFAGLDISSVFNEFALQGAVTFAAAVAGTQYGRIRRALLRRRFRKVFGKSVHGADDVMICLPLWSVKPGDPTIPRFSRQRPGGVDAGPNKELYGPTNTFAEEDVLGMVRISDMMARVFKQPIRITGDNTELEWSGKTVILVGSDQGNFYTESVLHLLRDEIDCAMEFGFEYDYEENPTEGAIVICHNNKKYKTDANTEYAYVIRLQNSLDQERPADENYIFVVAGVHAAGTYAAAYFLSRNWRKFARHKGNASVLLRLQRGRAYTVVPVAWHFETEKKDGKKHVA